MKRVRREEALLVAGGALPGARSCQPHAASCVTTRRDSVDVLIGSDDSRRVADGGVTLHGPWPVETLAIEKSAKQSGAVHVFPAAHAGVVVPRVQFHPNFPEASSLQRHCER